MAIVLAYRHKHDIIGSGFEREVFTSCGVFTLAGIDCQPLFVVDIEAIRSIGKISGAQDFVGGRFGVDIQADN